MTTVAEYDVLIEQTEKALHDVMVGNMPTVVVDQNGERMERKALTRKELESYLTSLRAKRNLAEENSVIDIGGPINLVF